LTPERERAERHGLRSLAFNNCERMPSAVVFEQLAYLPSNPGCSTSSRRARNGDISRPEICKLRPDTAIYELLERLIRQRPQSRLVAQLTQSRASTP
jgi:hypothetical protein